MATTRRDRGKEEDAESGAGEMDSAAAVTPPKRRVSAWLPLAVNIVLMPFLAYGVTTWLLLPKVKSAHEAAASANSGPLEENASQGEQGAESRRGKFVAPLGGKVLVNIAKTMGTRYLLTSLTLVSSSSNLKELIEQNDAQLRDVAAGVLAGKTIADLEKPEARNLIRAELISVFNGVLGAEIVTELYLTEFAIQ